MKCKILLFTLVVLLQTILFAQSNTEDTNVFHEDGPYVFYEDERINVVEITDKGLDTKVYSLDDDIVLTVKDPTTEGKTFEVKLRKDHAIEKDRYPLPSKAFITSDIEGEFYSFKKMLIDGEVINEDFEWIYGSGHLFIVGDAVDRGANVTEELWLIYKLEQEAKEVGGAVHYILGNHDVMNVIGDFRYVNKKYKENAAYMNRDYSEFFSVNSEFGRWIKKKNIIEKADDIIFVHAGISPEVAALKLPIRTMNDYGRRRLNGETCRGTCSRVTGGSTVGLYWYRGMGRQVLTQDQVDKIMLDMEGERVIIAHTIFPQITPLYNGKVIAIDIDHSKDLKNNRFEALVLENGCFKQFITEKDQVTKNDLLGDCNRLSTNERGLLNKTVIYPNPAKDRVYLKGVDKNSKVELYTINGGKLNVSPEFLSDGISINLQSYKSGIYILKLLDENNQTQKYKLIKE